MRPIRSVAGVVRKLTPIRSDFDSDVFGVRVGWAHDLDFEQGDFDLVFLSSGWPAPLHPRASVVDVRFDMALRLGAGVRDDTSRVAVADRSEDRDFAADLAASQLAPHSRYFLDERLAPRAGEVYRRWVSAVYERGDLLVVRGSGFLCVSRAPTRGPTLRLDLVAVAPDRLGDGTADALMYAFLALPDAGERRVRVGVGNVRAIHYYIKHGFMLADAECVQHVWAQTGGRP